MHTSRFAACTFEQRSSPVTRTVAFMQLRQPNGAAIALWIMAAGLIGFFGGVTSLAGAALVLGVGLVPPIIVLMHWRRPARARQPNARINV